MTAGITFWGRQEFYFPSLRSGNIITVPIAMVLALVPALVWALVYDFSRFVLTRTSLRVGTLAVGDWLLAFTPALVMSTTLLLLQEQAAARNTVLFLMLTLAGQAVTDRYYVFLVPTLYLLCCLAFGWAFGDVHPDWWAVAIDAWDPGRDGVLCLVAAIVASLIFLTRKLRN